MHSLRFEHPIQQESELNGVILQDQDGFFWIGSPCGVFRYDGVNFAHYFDHAHPLSYAPVTAICEDRAGNLCFGSGAKGVFLYHKESSTFTRLASKSGDIQGLSGDIVTDLLEDSQGILWIGTTDGLSWFDPRPAAIQQCGQDLGWPVPFCQNEITSLCEDREGVLWVGTRQNGVIRFDRRTGVFRCYQHDPDDPNSLSSNWVSALYEDRQGVLWVGTQDNGLNRFVPPLDSFIRYQHDPQDANTLATNCIFSLFEDTVGTLWMAHFITEKSGLSSLNGQRDKFTHYSPDPNNAYSISSEYVTSIYQDRTGILWVVCGSGEIDKYDPYSPTFTLYQHQPYNPNSLSFSAVIGIYEDRQGMMWFGTGKGLNSFNRHTKQFRRYECNPDDPTSLPHVFTPALLEDYKGRFWVGAYGGVLCQFDRKRGICARRYTHEPDNPFSIAKCVQIRYIIEDRDDPAILWLATFLGGVERFDTRNEQFTHYNQIPGTSFRLDEENISTLYEDGRGHLWIPAPRRGVFCLNKDRGTFAFYSHQPEDPESLANNEVMEVYEDVRGRLWVATLGGLHQFDRESGKCVRFNNDTGFPASKMNSIREDNQGHLWLGTDHGLLRFCPDSGATKLFTKEDGLQGNEFFATSRCKSHDGALWFGGMKGVNAFYPEQLHDNPYRPPVVITAFKQGGESLEAGKAPERIREIALDWRHNFFEFEYIAFNYTKPEKNQYAYMLEGFDQQWYFTGPQRFGRYTNLPGGTYTLRVKACNNDGLWNEAGTAITVHVGTPFWKTPWFIILCILSVVGIVALIFYARTRALKAEKEAAEKFSAMLEQKVEERTAELARANKEIQALNERLKEENLRMQAELNVARQLQQMVLPTFEELRDIEGLDIAGFMKPADEVGGDYYDVLSYPSGVKIGIGDVTGHGLESGVLMLMTQTAIRTLLDHGETDPVRFLNTLNRTIYNNTRRMNVEKSLTLALVSYKAGHLTIVGQHEQIIIMRKGGNVELVDTIDLGFPIGLEEDISEFVAGKDIHLTAGDGVVLYTDGFPEAENLEGEFYGLKRLYTVISLHWDESVEAIKQAVFEDVRQFIGSQIVYDDLTLVILKQR